MHFSPSFIDMCGTSAGSACAASSVGALSGRRNPHSVIFLKNFHRHSARKAWLKGGIGQQVVVHPVAENYGCEVGSSFWSSIFSYVHSCSLADLLI